MTVELAKLHFKPKGSDVVVHKCKTPEEATTIANALKHCEISTAKPTQVVNGDLGMDNVVQVNVTDLDALLALGVQYEGPTPVTSRIPEPAGTHVRTQDEAKKGDRTWDLRA